MPEQGEVIGFLDCLPHGATILDAGCGSGRYAAALKRGRPDLCIDLLDMNLDSATLVAEITANEQWVGARYCLDLLDFSPSKQYDGIWIYHTLPLQERANIERIFTKLCTALKPQGVIAATLIDDVAATQPTVFTGTSIDSINNLCALNNMMVAQLVKKDLLYTSSNISLPTYLLLAKKSDSVS